MDYEPEQLKKLVDNLLELFRQELLKSSDLHKIYGSLAEALEHPAEQLDAIQELSRADGRMEMMQKTFTIIKQELGV